MLFNEPKLLKFAQTGVSFFPPKSGFSALQRAEIAEMLDEQKPPDARPGFSALQRAEIAEIKSAKALDETTGAFQCSSTSRNC